jgi:hypothetical protein
MSTWLLIAALAVYGSWFVFNERWRVAPFRRRHDHRELWMAAIPSDDHRRVDDLLSAICDAFLIPCRYRFRLRPSDDVHTFYRRNMRGQFADSLEYVHLIRRLEGFGVDAERVVTEQPCTVGTLVRCITNPKGKRTTERASPNGGPATQLGNSGVTEGPPSVIR